MAEDMNCSILLNALPDRDGFNDRSALLQEQAHWLIPQFAPTFCSSVAPSASIELSVFPDSDQCLRHEDARWARHDHEVLVKFRGQFVVPYLRQIVAHGHVVQDVLDEAARVTGRKPQELPVCHIDDPLYDLPH